MPDPDIGVGPTAELSLRVSIGTLCRVTFAHPTGEQMMLALERTATLFEGSHVVVKAQPFGGAIRLLDPGQLKAHIGRFHFDSQRSKQDLDFRIQIRPADWEKVYQWCTTHLEQETSPVLDDSPVRELAEELEDCLKEPAPPDSYAVEPAGLIVHEAPTPTENIRARQQPTARIYRIFSVRVLDPVLIGKLLVNSASHTDQDLERQALQDAKSGGKGRANAALVLPFDPLADACRALPTSERNQPFLFATHRLAGNVSTILGVTSSE